MKKNTELNKLKCVGVYSESDFEEAISVGELLKPLHHLLTNVFLTACLFCVFVPYCL